MRTMILCALVVAAAHADMASAGVDFMPTRIDIGAYKCEQLLALRPESQERALIYLTGVMDGRRQSTVFDAAVAGPAIDRLLAACRTSPQRGVLDTFAAAWR